MAIYENTNLQEDYVSFETAKLLKEKGFDECANCQYPICGIHYGEVGEYNITDRSRNSENYIAAPTLQMAMKWLREVHNLFIQITIIPYTTVTIEQNYYVFAVCKDRRNLTFRSDHPHDSYSTYEEACEAAIKYCLENLI